MRILVIRNPTSGKADWGLVPAIVSRLEAQGCQVVVRDSREAGNVRALAASALIERWDRFVVAGGDGTVNEVLNGLASAAEPPALALIPAGTANVLAAEIGLSADPAVVAETILEGDLRPICLGDVDGRRFVMMAGAGFDARLVARVNPRLKALFGKGAYLWSGIGTLFAFGRARHQVTIDGKTYRAASVIVMNGRCFAGRYVLAPAARLDRPDLQVCLFERGDPLSTLRYVVRTLMGRLPGSPGYRVLPGCEIEIRGDQRDPVQLDGDATGMLPASIRVVAGAVRIAFPR